MAPPELLRRCNLPWLPLLTAAPNQMNLKPNLAKVNPVPRPKVDPQLRNSLPHRRAIPKIPPLHPIDPLKHNRRGLRIKRIQPLREGLSAIGGLTNQDLSENSVHGICELSCVTYRSHKG
jgi:hypothetical protein